jgi:hypothetical protein
MTAEEFGIRLSQVLLDKLGANEYLHVRDLRESISAALSPQKINIEFPKALFKDSLMIMVNSREEETGALAQGFTRIAPPQYAEGFPKFFREKTTHEGGTRGQDIRRVMIRTEEELVLFCRVIDEEAWAVDNGQYGGRGIGLADLAQERRELLAALLAAEDFTADANETADAPDDVIPESSTQTGANPDAVAPGQE